jgi:hypothetical protein
LPATAPGAGRSLQQSIEHIISSISIHHHHTLGDFGGPVAAAEVLFRKIEDAQVVEWSERFGGAA